MLKSVRTSCGRSALLYEYRWTIEIFFRQFKHLLGCRHLLCHNENGITIQTYCAIIACLLIALWTGRKPTKQTQEMLAYFLTGWATAEEVTAHIAKLKQADEAGAKRTEEHHGSTTPRRPSSFTLRARHPTLVTSRPHPPGYHVQLPWKSPGNSLR